MDYPDVGTSGGVFHEKLMTEVHRIAYNFMNRVGVIHMPEGCCVDMTGAISVFQAIDPEVRKILTFAGTRLDTSYIRRSPISWVVGCRREDHGAG